MVIYGSLKVVDGDIVAKGASGYIVIFEDGGSCETDTMGGWEQTHHVLGIDAVLGAVRFVAHQYNIMVGGVRLGSGLIEFVNKGEDVRRIFFQAVDKVLTARRDEIFRFAGQQAANSSEI